MEQPSTPEVNLDKTDVLFFRKSPSQFAGSIKPLQKIRKHIPLPVRMYYHDVTFHPISLTEWLCGNMIATDYEREDGWRRIVDTSVSR